MLRLALALTASLLAGASLAQQAERANGLFLIAKPSLQDPNFRQTVVLVTQTPDFHTVGVIINRPTDLKLQQFFPNQQAPETTYGDAVYFGGPVMRQVLVAVLRSDEAPRHASFHVLKNVFLTMHPGNIESLLKTPGGQYRLYAGFSGWAPRQLESEFAREGWYVLPADAQLVFRKDTSGLWQELLDKATRPRAGTGAGNVLALHKNESPAGAGLPARGRRAVP